MRTTPLGPLESIKADSWTQSATEYDSFEKRWHFYETVAERLVRELPIRSDSRVLELASGTGACTSILARLCPDGEVVGLEQSEGMIDVAKGNARSAGFNNVRFVQGDAGDVAAALRGVSFDMAVCNSAFWHFPDGSGVLKALRGLLRSPRLVGMSFPAWVSSSAERRAAHRAKLRELLLNHGVAAEEIERGLRESEARRTDLPELLRTSGYAIIKDVSFEFEFAAEGRQQWRAIPVFSSSPRSRSPLLSKLDPSVAAEVRVEMAEWRRQSLPPGPATSRWRILVAEVGESS